ncbi:MAG: helix-turn-helix domain-containing protein [Cloacibacterium sp.]|nr:helix-turn-helix domain-containing protein [Cloacibacterium sp.]
MNAQLFNLVEHTNRSIFLTGKAGTGKTTFLNDFVQKTRKKFVVVAPTGIAAINAGGVTIHSMFGLPLRPFVPTLDRVDTNLAMNISDLMPHFKYRKEKLKLLREVEIIIIDEVSMLRADILDMMDFSLRSVRRNQQKFGGVQMLFIGDLYQLPPVVRDENEYILKKYYASPFFFDAVALQETNLLTIELTEVFRQKDEDFLKILNAIRDGDVEHIDFDKLNERYIPNFEPDKESFVYLCSHNRMADDINQQKLKELKTKSYFYKAKVFGDFRENQYPNDEILEFKVGAQIMFIRNDASGERKYFNGKLAEISHLEEDKISVVLDGTNEEITLKKEVWEQKRYSLDYQKNIEEEVLGSFEQYPIRLAWAVTIHKSQGLTFDRLIIDAGRSFASGQVYVALSRCRTLEGIVLKSKITPEVIFSDSRVSTFQDSTHANDKVDAILETEKYDYSIKKVLRYTDCLWFNQALEDWYSLAKESKFLDKQKAKELYETLLLEVKNMSQIFQKFEKVLLQKTQKFIENEENWQEIENKAKGAVNFFFDKVKNQLFEPAKQFYAETKGIKGLKEYNEEMRNLLDDTEDYLKDLKKVYLLETKLFEDKNDHVVVSTKIAKIPTHILTYQLFEEGKSVGEIAEERGLVISTIYGHLAKFSEQGLLDLTRVFDKQKIEEFQKVFHENPQDNLTSWKQVLSNDFEYNEIRVLWNHFEFLKNKNENNHH